MPQCRLAVLAPLVVLACACGSGSAPPTESTRLPWALAIHGGAGVVRSEVTAEHERSARASLERVLDVGARMLDGGADSLDVVEAVVRELEDDPLFNAGRGAVFNASGESELDASIMDGRTRACGAVAAVRTVRNPVSLARRVMERTPHVLIAGTGADRLAAELGVETVDPGWFFTERRWQALERFRARARAQGGGTVGAVALDRRGNLAAATSTGGTTGKLPGRVGDSPIVGAGTWADNATCAVSGTGRGEEFIRHAVAHSIAVRIELGGASVERAAEDVVRGTLQPGDGGVIAIDRNGRIAMVFNTEGMYRGAADASGRSEVAVWE
jgi:isoaspartyl peptidase/L-asparaginase-like protein (Ntn-hydrolase superfamily)